MSHFFAIDVETANSRFSSICQIGLVEFRDGEEVSVNNWLIHPESYFDPINVRLHGITAKDVASAPKFKDVAPKLRHIVGDALVVAHSGFDRTALSQACQRADVAPFAWTWIDSMGAARRTWTEFASGGYGLADIAGFLGIEFSHHDAVEDARTAGQILLKAMEVSGNPVDKWPARSNLPVHWAGKARDQVPAIDGPLAGDIVLFSGALPGRTKDQCKTLVNELGGRWKESASKKITLLVVGDQDPSKLLGHDKSEKHREIEKHIENGIPIRIWDGEDFMAFCADAGVLFA